METLLSCFFRAPVLPDEEEGKDVVYLPEFSRIDVECPNYAVEALEYFYLSTLQIS